MPYIRSGSFKRLFSVIRRSSFDEESLKQTQGTHNENAQIVPFTQPSQKPACEYFSYEDIFQATNGFSSECCFGSWVSENLVGKGGYAEVYRGVLRDGQAIAVKRLTRASTDERKEKEFLSEIGTIGHVSHPNVSSLLGCCIDHGLYLIFQFSSRGSVASLLHDENSPTLNWKLRYKIATGAAKGLHYLHKGCQRRIIHRDIKASNILLTDDFEPQISDFGLAKWLPSQLSHHSIVPIEGTFGHLAPEYFMHGIVDEKTDVFAFGVFLLEIISGRKPVDGSHQSLHSWAKPFLKRGEIEKLVDAKLRGAYDTAQLKRLAFAASLCIRASSTWRPTMSEVLEVMIDGDLDKAERWEMPEEEEKEEVFWGFEDLECVEDDSRSSSFSTSPHDTISTGNSYNHVVRNLIKT
ncbi:Serine-threonine/tyrosine-protein kinase, catalytic domain [Dillenia turbinata]|uniref:Serine-threonine/tyrosine-protein kinase, catalytic domain n=1 Tax=Dillenia turbinata TaxID=194707 RepID=A0AAN8ZPZ7_9MAGN